MNPDEFRTFGMQHLIVLGIIAAGCFLIIWKTGALSSTIRTWIGRLLGSILALYAIVLYSQLAMEGSLSWQYSLPLELCHLILIVCILALFNPNRILTEIAYFLGLGGVLQATLTPDVFAGFPSWDFIFFFWGHGVMIWAIVFLIVNRKFTPEKASLIRMMIALNLYGLIIGIIDAIAGWNYGYLRHKPYRASLLDVLGPWPWYLFSLEIVAFITFMILYLPWRIFKRLPDATKTC
jgi:hypothetical integral membrane protein (TIGR02206 family)